SDRPLEILDVATVQGQFVTASDIFARERVRSALIQPLSDRRTVIGAVSYLERAPRRFTTGEQDRIEPLGNLWALAIENAHLHESALRNAREAEAAREQLQQFLGLVVHDLRNPLTIIFGYSQMLIRQPAVRESPVVSGHLRTIERACLQMQRLVRDLLDASRIGTGHFQVEPETMDLAALARRAVEQVRASNPTRSVIVEAPEHLVGVWDPIRLSQVLENLLTNALKYSPSECEVSVRLTREENEARLSVTDHGVGIAPEQIEALFQPFSRPIQNPEVRGIGLGLYITKGIVEAMHGRIWVESAVGKGSTFYVTLPIQSMDLATTDRSAA
ncbi:MAG TPA: HAMP domain-containing sensor histidine kinase, partial [Chloroflexota bacterium]|nr:HAMP domain-containing sensor histidine kinase [Chloroflexota bacterium]